MARGSLGKLASRTLSVVGKWQHQQLRRLNIHEYQGAELMGKYGINVPRGVAAGSVQGIKDAMKNTFPSEKEVKEIVGPFPGLRGLTSDIQLHLTIFLLSFLKKKNDSDTKHWNDLVSEVYFSDFAVNWSSVRNVMDMNAGFGGSLPPCRHDHLKRACITGFLGARCLIELAAHIAENSPRLEVLVVDPWLQGFEGTRFGMCYGRDIHFDYGRGNAKRHLAGRIAQGVRFDVVRTRVFLNLIE